VKFCHIIRSFSVFLRHNVQCSPQICTTINYDTVDWVILPVKSSLKWLVMCWVGR